MKLNTTIQTIAAVVMMAFGSSAYAKPDQIPGVSEKSGSYFYTGKPYDTDLTSYAFTYRAYDPTKARWTISDPSGFPDGANNNLYVNNATPSNLDDTGLKLVTLFGTFYTTIVQVQALVPTSWGLSNGSASSNTQNDLSTSYGISTEKGGTVNVNGPTNSNTFGRTASNSAQYSWQDDGQRTITNGDTYNYIAQHTPGFISWVGDPHTQVVYDDTSTWTTLGSSMRYNVETKNTEWSWTANVE